jgi:hypothetical protein
MTDEFDLLKRLFGEDAEPSKKAWANLRDRTGVEGRDAVAVPQAVAVPASSPPAGADSPLPEPQIWLTEPSPARARPRLRRRLVLVGVAASVLAAFGIVAAGAFSREDTVHSALASLFGSPTLEVVFTAQTASNDPTVGQYSVALTVSSENGSQPLSGSDGVDDFEVSVYRSGTDLGDVLIADGAVYGRLNLEAISPSDYSRASQSVTENVPSGDANTLAEAFLNDQWVGVDDATIGSFVKSLGVRSSGPSLQTDRNAAAMSFAQSWETWASIQEVSSSNGTTEYSLNMPARSFLNSFLQHLEGALSKEVPSLKRDAGLGSALIKRIPASLTIPMNLWVSGGSLTQLDISYKGNSLDMAISHPATPVSAPTGAVMLTTATINSLESDYNLCSSGSPSLPPNSQGDPCGCPASESTPPSGTTPSSGSLGGGFCTAGIFSILDGGLLGLEGSLFGGCTVVTGTATGSSAGASAVQGLSGVSSLSGVSGLSGTSAISGLSTGTAGTSGISSPVVGSGGPAIGCTAQPVVVLPNIPVTGVTQTTTAVAPTTTSTAASRG